MSGSDDDTTDGAPALARYLTGDELAAVLALGERVTLEAGEPLLRLGALGDRLYYVQRGELAISLPLEDRTLALGTRHAGTWVGEITWLEPGPVTATVIATRDAELYALGQAELGRLGRERPDVAARLVRAISEDLARRIRHAGVVLERPRAVEAPGALRRLLRGLVGGGEA